MNKDFGGGFRISSAVRKNTMLSQFLVRYPNSRYSISATTCKPRPGEIPGKNYYFYSREQFQSLLEQNQFLEWAKVYDEYYGTPLAPILEGLESGQVIVMDLDVQGALQVKRRLPEAVLVFLLPPSIAALKARLIKRGTESAQDMDKRLEACQEEIASARSYDYLVVNCEVSRAVDQLICIVEAEKLRLSRQAYLIDILTEGGTIGN